MSKDEFVTFAEKYMDTIYRVAYSWTKNSHDANDVTQDVLIQLYKTTKEFESDSHIKNWLIKVTVNQCKMLFRSPWNKMEDTGENGKYQAISCKGKVKGLSEGGVRK